MSTTSNAYIVVTSLDAKQRAVLQAIYDYFHEHAKWPKFITIDRPLVVSECAGGTGPGFPCAGVLGACVSGVRAVCAFYLRRFATRKQP